MSPPPNERSHPPNAPPYAAGRRTMYGASQSARQSQYTSLGDALGGMRQTPQYPGSVASPDYPPSSVSTSSVSHNPHLPSDPRTQYTPSGIPSYDYAYQQSSYEPISQYSHSSLPPMRTTSPYSALNQPIAQYSTHSAPYASSYSQTPYVLGEDDWGQSPQSFTPDAVQPMFVAGRSDVSASPQIDPRPYVQQQYSIPPANIQQDERSVYSGDLSPSSKGKNREHDTGRAYRSPSNSTGAMFLDYTKLLNTYSQLYGECHVINQRGTPGSPDPLDDIDSMIRTAKFGLQLFQATSPPAAAAEHRRTSEDSRNSAENESISPQLPAKRQAEATPASDGQKCLGCGATATPEWRRGPLGPRTLCNACGLVYAKMIKKRGGEAKQTTGNTNTRSQAHAPSAQLTTENAPSVDSAEGHSDDELSSGSQDPH